MSIENKRQFIIQVVFIVVVGLLIWLLGNLVVTYLTPFLVAFLLAYLIKRPARWISKKTKLNEKFLSLFLVLLFFSTIGVVFSLVLMKGTIEFIVFARMIPDFYNTTIQPFIVDVMNQVEPFITMINTNLDGTFDKYITQIVGGLGTFLTNYSLDLVAWLSTLASKIPTMIMKTLITIIATFFLVSDYHTVTNFLVKQVSQKQRDILYQIKEYLINTVFVCIRSYAIIMTLTFVELSIGLCLIGIENAIFIALLISIFDILPVLGTGGIMIPWTLITALQGDYRMAILLGSVYVVVTVIRNIVEPKIVGQQIGLHPLLALASMFVGVGLFGIVGLFGAPILISLLIHLNKEGIIHLYQG